MDRCWGHNITHPVTEKVIHLRWLTEFLITFTNLTGFHSLLPLFTFPHPILFSVLSKDAFKAPQRSVEKPFRLCVSDVYKGKVARTLPDSVSSFGGNKRLKLHFLPSDQGSGFCVTGKIEAGYIQTGDRILAMPPNETCTVKGTHWCVWVACLLWWLVLDTSAEILIWLVEHFLYRCHEEDTFFFKNLLRALRIYESSRINQSPVKADFSMWHWISKYRWKCIKIHCCAWFTGLIMHICKQGRHYRLFWELINLLIISLIKWVIDNCICVYSESIRVCFLL